MKDFNGRVAVITGAASGIGRALAERCAHEGMKVVLADVEAGPLAEVEAKLQAGGGTAEPAILHWSRRHSHIARYTVSAAAAAGELDVRLRRSLDARGGPTRLYPGRWIAR